MLSHRQSCTGFNVFADDDENGDDGRMMIFDDDDDRNHAIPDRPGTLHHQRSGKGVAGPNSLGEDK